MNKLSIVILGGDEVIEEDELLSKYIDVINYSGDDLGALIDSLTSKYVAFIKKGDSISKEYLILLFDKINEEFDCCFINYKNMYAYINEPKVLKNEGELALNKPYYGSYIWNYIFNVDKLKKIIRFSDEKEFNENVDLEFKNVRVIREVIYNYYPNEKAVLSDFCYKDIRDTECYKNVIYVGNGCNGTFNGYISWINNIGRCFGKKYEITVLYDEMPDITLSSFKKYFNCVKYDKKIDYICERLLVTYSTYYYKANIYTLEENYLFIHGNMSDYENTRRYSDDIYSKYIAVSKVAAEKAVGYFPTDDIKWVLNPFKLDKGMVKKHLSLVSAQRHCDIKRPERIEILAGVFDQLDIPYTWNVFSDKFENTNKNGIVYRRRVQNPLPYIVDADYFVLLSDSEALSYAALEALSVNTKVIVTPLECFDELNVVDGDNGIVIPFEYFEEENRDKLVEVVKRIYEEKDKEFEYEYDESYYNGYNDIFKL